MKRYLENKPLNVQWISSIPQHWKQLRAKSIFYTTKQLNDDNACDNVLSLTLKGVIRNTIEKPVGLSPKDYCTYQIFEKDDLVFKLIDLENISTSRVGIVPEHGIMSPAYIRFSQRGHENIRYLFYQYYDLYLRHVYNGLGAGVRATLSASELLNIPIVLPPREEQDQIVRYLDWQVSKINRLIAAKRKEIALLHEQHKRRISEAVLHGNDDGCCQKDSGVEWIGMIPEHWSVIRCKYVFTERDERSIAGEEEHLSMSQKYGLVSDSKLDERRMLSESYVGGKVCYKNDLVLNRLKAHLGVFALSPQKGVISPDYTVLIPNAERILPTYGEAVLKNDLCRRELRIRVRGIIEGFWRLYTDDFNTIVIPLPPLKEQEQIMKHLSALNNKFTALKQRLEQEINILHELRTRLISDVVTGQVDVRGIQVPDDEYINNEITEEEFEEESENNEEE